eukprot:TRINITY_DN3907_c0_g1_i1.p1 TRINITY_DN3907_c0_g1~~TRINITY_DN3907_c0_g1_i1.p1  ORF type:complete len:276 (+),score=55.30 TRINITY_DN3907_c0_g1_i1:78-905(+)
MGCSSSTAAGVAAPAGNFKVALERSDLCQQIGLDVFRSLDPVGILVAAVADDGLVPIYNKHHASIPELQIKEGDIIVAVNSVSGDYDRMKKESKLEKVALTIIRPGGLVFTSGPRPDKRASQLMFATQAAEVGFAMKSTEPPAVKSAVELAPIPAAEAAVSPRRAMVKAPVPPEKAPPALPVVEVLTRKDCAGSGCLTPRRAEVGQESPAKAATAGATAAPATSFSGAAPEATASTASTGGPLREVSTGAGVVWTERTLASERTETFCKNSSCCL